MSPETLSNIHSTLLSLAALVQVEIDDTVIVDPDPIVEPDPEPEGFRLLSPVADYQAASPAVAFEWMDDTNPQAVYDLHVYSDPARTKKIVGTDGTLFDTKSIGKAISHTFEHDPSDGEKRYGLLWQWADDTYSGETKNEILFEYRAFKVDEPEKPKGNETTKPNYGQAVGVVTGRATRVANLARRYHQGASMINRVRDVPATGLIHDSRAFKDADMQRDNPTYIQALKDGWTAETYGCKSEGLYSCGDPHFMAAIAESDSNGLPVLSKMVAPPSRDHIKSYSVDGGNAAIFCPFGKEVMLEENVRYALLLMNAYPPDNPNLRTFKTPNEASAHMKANPKWGMPSQNGSYIKDPNGIDDGLEAQPHSEILLPDMETDSIFSIDSSDGVNWSSTRKGLHFPFVSIMYADGMSRGLTYTDYLRDKAEIDGLNRVRYVIIPEMDMTVARIAVEYSHHNKTKPNGKPLTATLTGKSGTTKVDIDGDSNLAVQNRNTDQQFAAGYSVYRSGKVSPFPIKEGEKLTLELDAPVGAAFRAWFRYPRLLTLDGHVPNSQMERSSDGGKSWIPVGYRTTNTCGYLLLPS